ATPAPGRPTRSSPPPAPGPRRAGPDPPAPCGSGPAHTEATPGAPPRVAFLVPAGHGPAQPAHTPGRTTTPHRRREAQLAVHRSPKPAAVGSTPTAPATTQGPGVRGVPAPAPGWFVNSTAEASMTPAD